MEAAAAGRGWPEEQLLAEAGKRLGHALAEHFPQPGTAIGYLGKGHNAGDTLVALRVLARQHGWRVVLRAAHPPDQCAPLTRSVWSEADLPAPEEALPDWRGLPRPLVLLDGLLGIGAQGAPRPPLTALVEEMAWLRSRAGAVVAAVDLPSGVDPDTGEIHPGAVTADITFMIGAPKIGLLAASAANATGALVVVPVQPLTPLTEGAMMMISPQSLAPVHLPRPYDFHKGMAGRVAVLAGSTRYPGAAALAATGALRGGAGLVYLFSPPDAVAAIAAKCPPEIIIRSAADPREVLDAQPDALVIGPGLLMPSATWAAELARLLADTTTPTVLDAEALGFLALENRLELLRGHHLLTPHPGEFARLAPDLTNLPREEAARRFADRHPCVLLLKGCRTLVTERGAPLWCNPTGHPGMAVGGQGDVLSGVIGARLAIGDPPLTAACFASWCCGRAGEIAADRLGAVEPYTPSAGLDHLGAALRDWRERRR